MEALTGRSYRLTNDSVTSLLIEDKEFGIAEFRESKPGTQMELLAVLEPDDSFFMEILTSTAQIGGDACLRLNVTRAEDDNVFVTIDKAVCCNMEIVLSEEEVEILTNFIRLWARAQDTDPSEISDEEADYLKSKGMEIHSHFLPNVANSLSEVEHAAFMLHRMAIQCMNMAQCVLLDIKEQSKGKYDKQYEHLMTVLYESTLDINKSLYGEDIPKEVMFTSFIENLSGLK